MICLITIYLIFLYNLYDSSSEATVPSTHMCWSFHEMPLISWLEDRLVTDHAWKHTASFKNLHIYWNSVFLSWIFFFVYVNFTAQLFTPCPRTWHPSVCQSLLTLKLIAWRNKYKYTYVGNSAYWSCYINLVPSLCSLQNLQNKR